MGLHLSKIICFDLCHDLSTLKFCSIPFFFGIKCCSIYLTSGRSRGRSVLQKTHPFYFYFFHISHWFDMEKKKFHPVFCWNPVNLLNHLWRCQIFAPTVYLKTCFSFSWVVARWSWLLLWRFFLRLVLFTSVCLPKYQTRTRKEECAVSVGVITVSTKSLVLRFSRLTSRLECFCAHVPAH